MEQTELNQRLSAMFKEMLLVLESAKKGYSTGNQMTLTEAETKLTSILTSNLLFTEGLVKKKTKDEVEKKYLNLLPNLQLMAGIIRNLINEYNLPWHDECLESIPLELLFSEQVEMIAEQIKAKLDHQ